MLSAVGVLSRYYQSDLKASSYLSTKENFFTSIWAASSGSQLRSIADELQQYRSTNPSTNDRDALLKDLLRFEGLNSIKRKPASVLPPQSNLDPWLPIDPSRPRVSSVGQSISNKNALIIAPYAHEFENGGGDESNEVQEILKNSGFSVTLRRNENKIDQNIDIKRDFMNTNSTDYGIIVFVSHGSRFNGAKAMLDGEDNIPGGSPVGIYTGQSLTTNLVVQYSELLWAKDLRFDRISSKDSIDLAIMPSFVTKYMKNIGSNSLIYLGACQTLQNNSLADAFLARGSATIVGYTKDVGTNFAARHGTAMFNLLATGRGTDQIPGINSDQDGDAKFESRSKVSVIV